ncbi:MAG TPA: glycosyltransferase family 4 protein [Bacteroidota bacterium]|nr:glycosyltransferase family 4 protein [Bacteroidota bacterium]
MNITMGCYQAVSLIHGGPRVQILGTKKGLEELGVHVTLFDPWQSPHSKLQCDIFHLFSANVGTFHLARNIQTFSIPLVTSPIFFTQHAPHVIRLSLAVEHTLKRIRPGIWTDYGFTEQICNWSKAVLPNTSDESHLIEKGLGIQHAKVTVIPNGVDPKFEHGDPGIFKKKYGLDKFVLNVGHIGPARKNVLKLIHALQTIDCPAVIIGKIIGDEGKQCVEEASKNKKILIIPGLENDSEMLSSAYAACDVFVLPSLFETPGIAALEAGLAGAKIVVTPYGGTREYFGGMAAYVEPRSVESIRNGIVSALNENRNDKLVHHIKREYLWTKVAEKTLAVYKKVL